MKKLLKIIVSSILALCLCMPLFACSDGSKNASYVAEKDFTLSSPDGSLVTKAGVDAFGQVTYSVEKNGVEIVGKSSLGFDIEEDDFGIMSFVGEKTRRVDGAYEPKTGKNSRVEYDCNELVLSLKGYKFGMDITLRNYDDGYAFRYGIYALDGSNGVMTVLSENSEFALPDSQTWAMTYMSSTTDMNTFSYEESYIRRSSTGFGEAEISMPFMYKLRSNDIYSIITESELIGSGYYGSFLQEQQSNRGTGVLQTVHTPACNDPIRDNKIEYPFKSPWRVGIAGDLKTVQESELVEKLYDDADYWKPDDYDELSDEEKKIYDYDWVDPDVAAWSWLSYNGTTEQYDYDLHYRYVDLAAEMGWTYYLIDAEWDFYFDEAKWFELVEYAHDRNVKIMVWMHIFLDSGNGNEDTIAERFAEWRRLGIEGLKIDFFDGQGAEYPDNYGEDVETVKLYETVYREAAKNKFLINCHGSNKPTGERRIYPHVINREAVRGNEFKDVDSTVTVNELFVRNVVGPTDFTPVVTPLSSGLTMGHQIALAVLFESGTPSMADKVDIYRDETLSDLFKSVPAARDETVFLCGKPDEYYVAAVRVGDDWFVGGVCSLSEQTVEIDFSFLGDGNYTGVLYEDDIETDLIKTSSDTITKSSKKSVSMTFDGGFVYRLIKQK